MIQIQDISLRALRELFPGLQLPNPFVHLSEAVPRGVFTGLGIGGPAVEAIQEGSGV